jgi:hypothetical protein
MTRRCAVAVFFREPNVELYSQKKPTPRVAVFEVFAPNMAEAERRAIAAFREAEVLSSVGSVRSVVCVAIFVVTQRPKTAWV